MTREIHLVGTVPLPSTEAVLDALADTVAPFMPRIPDGETEERSYWVTSQARVLHEDPRFIPDGHDWAPGRPVPEHGAPKYRLREGLNADGLELASFGYGGFAERSYARFCAMRDSGRLPSTARFQVGLPTPLAFYTAIVSRDSQKDLAPAFGRRMAEELKDVLAVVPADDLAIQWDVCLEILAWEGVTPLHVTDPKPYILDELARLGDLVPSEAQLGYHLCYGDFRHKHAIEPKDSANMVTIANGVALRLSRPIDWIHMPVPRDRDDDAYFAPLANLELPATTKLFLGLVHYTDGESGTRRRMETASRHRADYGIATECGMGRRDPRTIPDLLALHARAATE